MTTSSLDDESLGALFRRAEAERAAIESSSPTSSADHGKRVAGAVTLYERVQSGITSLSLFSRNEAIDDVSTTSLPFLSVEWRLAELEAARWEKDEDGVDGRRAALGRARERYGRFLDLVDAYGLVVGPYEPLLERFRSRLPEEFSVVDEVGGGGGLAARRDAKIASFRAEKELRRRRDEAFRSVGAGVDDDEGEAVGEAGDDELLRGFYLAELAFGIHSAFNGVDAIDRELRLLSLAASAPPTTTKARGQDQEDDASRLDQPLLSTAARPLLSRGGKPLQPFTLVGSRADRARAVFRPGHNLPSMSVDEYLAEERRRGGILDGGGGGRAGGGKRPVGGDEDETYKARAWDDFKDDNPRGSGNTLNMG
ncbi:hypothetical protein L249_4127 [Ophiocordyceps polyrhachis-furcata BCC 54312]|uniref:TAP42-like protein n=1 Tax=Ophiocordyceps polyrhachis-furcata BCC 54312 TaxID=1330021 RepID=A0A367L584_9HYPO|nr:hypothetical protein L249_4127 [Ophiocordyceps polyrhachis-furcata BCC 54312]